MGLNVLHGVANLVWYCQLHIFLIADVLSHCPVQPTNTGYALELELRSSVEAYVYTNMFCSIQMIS